MPLPMLEEFIAQASKSWPHNSYVRKAGFASLYVRIAQRLLEGKRLTMLDIASVVASKPGNGAFHKLVASIKRKHPELGIYVECVLNPRFAKMLQDKMGFKRDRDLDSFYILGQP